MSEVPPGACPTCKQGALAPGTTTATFDAEGMELATAAAGWSGAPVQICDYE